MLKVSRKAVGPFAASQGRLQGSFKAVICLSHRLFMK
jgi:hypothetical protein